MGTILAEIGRGEGNRFAVSFSNLHARKGEASLNCRSGEEELLIGMLLPYVEIAPEEDKKEKLPRLTLITSGSNAEPGLRTNTPDARLNPACKHAGQARILFEHIDLTCVRMMIPNY